MTRKIEYRKNKIHSLTFQVIVYNIIMQSIDFVDSTYFFFDDPIFEVIILYKMKLFEN